MSSSFKINPKRSLFLGHDFTSTSVDKIIEKLFKLNLENAPIYLQIDSNGGSISGAKRLYDNIRFSSNKVIGVVIGECYSSAALILQACHQRYSSPLSKFGLHYVRLDFSFEANRNNSLEFYVNFLKKDFKSIKKNNQIIKKILKENLSVGNEEIENLLKNEVVLEATSAYKIGLIDRIIKY